MIFKSRRLRKKAFIKIALLAVPLAFLAVQFMTVGGLSKLALFAIIVISVFVLLTVIHLVLSRRQSRRRQGRNKPTIILPGPSPDNDSASASESAAETRDADTETAPTFITAPTYESWRITGQSPAVADQGNSRPVIALGADVSEVDAPAGSVAEKVSVESAVRSDNASSIDSAVSSGVAFASRVPVGAFTNTTRDEDGNTDAYADTDARLRHPAVDVDASEVDMDATIASPEELQEQVERVGDLVETHDLGSEQSVHHKDDVTIQGNRNRQDDLSEASTSLFTATSHADTANLAELSHSEVNQLVVKLKKDKVRLHRLVIAQQSAIDSERKAHDRSRTVARDAIKIMRNSREAQKLAETVARRERSKRKRIEQEYIKVSQALINARSIIKARKDETA